MLPRPLQIVLLVSLITATLGCAASATPAGLGPSAAAIRQLAAGVFEVVVPKLEDEQGTTYAVPLPTELVPFARRSDKFAGIGTAFALSPTRFVTAAHVMPLVGSYSDRYYLRDSSGATYEVGRITKYSQTRDLAELELLTPAASVVPLEPRTDVAIGETVFTVGNAIGEGIVARGGTITSRTPEPVEGKWSFLRFTAPASPGNSGGPLVDAAGRVLGVVVRKSAAENLNEAVPIQELLSLGSSSCELLDRGVLFADDHKEMLADWAF
jgi:serine protease Do